MISKPHILFCLSIFLGFSSLAFAAPPQLRVAVASIDVLVPGGSLGSLTFSGADGEEVRLPEEGRYLLWLVDGALALETRTEVPLAEFLPFLSRDERLALANLTLLIPRFADLGQGYVLFYQSAYTFLPTGAQRAEVQARFEPFNVLFDTGGTIQSKVSSGEGIRSLDLSGLYLMEGEEIRYRYLHRELRPELWEEEGVAELIVEGATAFLQGQEPPVVPLPVARTQTAIPDSVLALDGPALVLRVSGLAAEAPEDGLWIKVEENRVSTEGDHPASGSRFLLESLPPVLERYGVQGVALVHEAAENIPDLERNFPGWTFIPLDNPKERLRWLELRSALVVSGDGIVEMPLTVGAFNERGTAALERALTAVAGQAR